MNRFRQVFGVTTVLSCLVIASAAGQLWDKGGTNVIVVAKKGGDFNSIQAALDSITDASEDNPYLVYVAPGVYEEQIILKSYVAIEGAGRRLTQIALLNNLYTNHTQLRSLTIDGYAISASPSTSLMITDTTVRSRYIGVLCSDRSRCELRDVTIELETPSIGYALTIGRQASARADGVLVRVDCSPCNHWLTGVFVGENGYLDLTNSTIIIDGQEKSQGISVYHDGSVDASNIKVFSTGRFLRSSGGPLTVRHSEVHGDVLVNWDSATQISHSLLAGEVTVTGDADIACFSAHDADLNPLDENCQPIPPPGEDPHADFFFSATGLTVQFLNQSTGTQPLSYSWNFGDGCAVPCSTDANPVYVYAAPGTYNVTLTVTNALGTDSIQKMVTVSQ